LIVEAGLVGQPALTLVEPDRAKLAFVIAANRVLFKNYRRRTKQLNRRLAP
jgi:hypothetical protein